MFWCSGVFRGFHLLLPFKELKNKAIISSYSSPMLEEENWYSLILTLHPSNSEVTAEKESSSDSRTSHISAGSCGQFPLQSSTCVPCTVLLWGGPFFLDTTLNTVVLDMTNAILRPQGIKMQELNPLRRRWQSWLMPFRNWSDFELHPPSIKDASSHL